MNLPGKTTARLFVAALAALPVVSMAAVMEVESFDYPADTGSGLDGLDGGTGWGGAFSDADSLPTLATTYSSLSYPTGVPLTATGGRIETTGDSANNPVFRTLGTTISLADNGGVVYSSALFQISTIAADERASVLFDRSSDGVIRWYYGIDSTGHFSVAVDPSNTAQRATSTGTVAINTTCLLVAMIRNNTGPGGTDEVFLKVYTDGDSIVEPATDSGWDLTTNGNSGVTLDRVRFAFSNTAGETNAFDEFRVGTTFADVTGVPEPSAIALLGCAALLLCQRRRG